MLRAAALNNPAKGLPPLNPAHFFEKKWTKNFCLSPLKVSVSKKAEKYLKIGAKSGLKKENPRKIGDFKVYGGSSGTRTRDLPVMSRLL